jgi:hypothetical protein
VLKKSASNNPESIPRNNDSIATHILNHRCVTKARHDRKLRAKDAPRLFQHNRSGAVIRPCQPNVRFAPKAVIPRALSQNKRQGDKMRAPAPGEPIHLRPEATKADSD